MNSKLPLRRSAKSIFLAALRIDDLQARRLYLDRVCESSRTLRSTVERLLAAPASDGENLLDQAIKQFQAAWGSPEAEAARYEAPLDLSQRPMIGPYRLLEPLGEGGMGTVYMAQQTRPVRRTVALKVIKPGMDTKEAIARFDAERQTLALMHHANIASIFDAGITERGRPYFVMELVRGQPIDRYCKEASVTLRGRLTLFIDVCRAVQHAHQKGIIHRDLKPSNILVTLDDGIPVVKVIDFGIAKALDQKLTDRTLFTRFAQLVGTPVYMSPEQAELSGLDIDTRSDVYSLGVVLYKLLVGVTPFDEETLKNAGMDEMRRIIREDDPPRPSHRLSTLRDALATTVPDRRAAESGALSHSMWRELDWIVMKALEKDRTRRYESASALAEDIQRYLGGQPVEACPPSRLYRFRKIAARNKAALATALTLTVCLVGFSAVAGWQAVEATSAKRRFAEEAARAEDGFRKALDAVDRMLTAVADERLQQLPGAQPVRKELFADAIRFYEQFLAEHPDDPLLRLEIGRAWTRLAKLQANLDDGPGAQDAYRKSLATLEPLRREQPDSVEVLMALADSYEAYAINQHYQQGQTESAERAYNEASRSRTLLARRTPEDLENRFLMLQNQCRLGNLYGYTGRTDQAERILRRAVAAQKQIMADPTLADEHGSLSANLLALAGVVGGDPWIGDKTNGRCAPDAEQLFLEAVSEAEKAGGGGHLGMALLRYGQFLQRQGRPEEAVSKYRRAVATVEPVIKRDPQQLVVKEQLGWMVDALFDILAKQGRWTEIEGFLETGSADAHMHFTVGDRYFHLGQFDRAFPLIDRAVQLDPEYSEAYDHRGQIHLYRGQWDEAIADLDASLQYGAAYGGYTYGYRGLARYFRGDYDLSLSDLRQALHGGRPDSLDRLPFGSVACCPDEKFREHFFALVDRSIQLSDEPAAARLRRAALHIALGREEDATTDLEDVAGREAVPADVRHRSALLRLQLGDLVSYRAQCRQMLSDFAEGEDDDLRLTAWTCALAAGAVDDYRPVVALARRAVGQVPTAKARSCLAAALYRAQMYEEAERESLAALEIPFQPPIRTAHAQYLLAMSQYRLGKMEEARETLTAADRLADAALQGCPPWWSRMALERLGREAESLIE